MEDYDRYKITLLRLTIIISIFFLNIDKSLSEYVELESNQSISVYAVDTENGKEIFSLNPDEYLIPASILKLFTAATALEDLGTEFRFSTQFYTRSKRGELKDLVIRGEGDPSFTSESLWMSIRSLKARGITEVGDVILDDSYFKDAREALSERAYAAGNSSLSFNHNSVGITVCPSKLGSKAIISYEPKEIHLNVSSTAVTSRSQNNVEVEDLGNDSFKVSGMIGETDDCVTIYRSVRDIKRYFGESLLGFAKDQGIIIKGDYKTGSINPEDKLVFIHKGEPLSRILQDMNQLSSNFIAEQILYTLGRSSNVASKQEGSARVFDYLKNLGLPISKFRMRDGSGLDRDNKVSARLVVDLLVGAKRQSWWNQFLNSLSISSLNGTLKKRDFRSVTVYGKTGTLNGVTSLAGYFYNKERHLVAFAIIQNGISETDKSRKKEENIVELINDK